MKRKMKRFLGILFSFALVLGLMPGMNLTAYAAEYSSGTSVTVQSLQAYDVLESGVTITVSGAAFYLNVDGGLVNAFTSGDSWTTDKKYRVDRNTFDGSFVYDINLITVVESYTVTYNANGGGGTMTDSTSYTSGSTVNVLRIGFTAPDNKVFAGFKMATGDIIYANASDSIAGATASFTITGNTTLTAQWADAPAHIHTWATAWSHDATYHWHACTGEGASDACLNETGAAKATHTYGDTGDARFTCTVCEYVDTTKQAEAGLADAKTTATATVNGVDANDYTAADQQTVTDAKTTALAAITAATTEAEVTTALTNFNTAIANCTTQAAADQVVIQQVMSEVSAKTGSGMTYTGNPIQLINTPTTALPTGYTMKYAVTTENTAPTDDSLYTTSIPSKTDAGT